MNGCSDICAWSRHLKRWRMNVFTIIHASSVNTHTHTHTTTLAVWALRAVANSSHLGWLRIVCEAVSPLGWHKTFANMDDMWGKTLEVTHRVGRTSQEETRQQRVDRLRDQACDDLRRRVFSDHVKTEDSQKDGGIVNWMRRTAIIYVYKSCTETGLKHGRSFWTFGKLSSGVIMWPVTS